MLVAQLGTAIRPTKLFRIAYEGTISDETRFAVLGGDAETIKGRFSAAETDLEPLDVTLRNAVAALAGADRKIDVVDLEVCVLQDMGDRRTFTRLTDERVAALLGT